MGKMNNLPGHITSDEDFILLLPFSHQIGGHNIVLQYDDSTICKLLNLREKYFYETIPQDLYEYLPKYKGTIEVKIQEDDKGSKTFLAYHHNVNHQSSDNTTIDNDNKNQENLKTTPTLISSNETNKDDLSSQTASNTTTTDNNNHKPHTKILTTTTTTNYMNPTVSKLQKTFLSKMDASNDDILNFILLENMVAKYKYPCILDIKMGTQQHGDDASEQKKQVQTLKCQMSTSSKIGSRLCGMQVYQVNTRKYICFDKYEGRTLSVDGFKRNLLQYLNNGNKYRIDVIDPIIEKLERLYQIIDCKSTYRFYGSSLLVLYDGFNENDSDCKNVKIDVRMIDFAHSTHSGYKDPKKHNGPDRGYLFGLENLIKIFKEIKNDCIELQSTASLQKEQINSQQQQQAQLVTETANNSNEFLNKISHIKLKEPLQAPPDPTPSPSLNSLNSKNHLFFLQSNEPN